MRKRVFFLASVLAAVVSVPAADARKRGHERDDDGDASRQKGEVMARRVKSGESQAAGFGGPRRNMSNVARAWLLAVLFGAAPVTATSESLPACPDQAATLLPRVEALVSQFKDELTIARQTPRISLAPGISRLRTIWRQTIQLAEWPEVACQFRLRETLDVAESHDIQRLETFMASSRRSASRKAAELWADADRNLKDLRELVEATRTR